MNESVKKELKAHVVNLINEGVLTNDNVDDWHHHAFNEDYYIVGYYQCSEWLKKHDIDPFEAISKCVEYERDNFGEVSKSYNNSEETVNMLVYVLGEDIIHNNAETVEELKENLED